MDEQQLKHFKKILQDQLKQRTDNVRESQANALEMKAADDGPKDSVDMSLQDVNQEIALRLGERESKMVAEIDQALLRIKEGSYGICARCGNEINEKRLQAIPTARYCAACQEYVEQHGEAEEISTL